MKYFDLTLPAIGEENPKIHKIFFEDFRKSWVDFPRPLAERMVELGYGVWAPCTINGAIPVPQALVYPKQMLFVGLPTLTVKAVHVNSLVPENGPVPNDLALFCNILLIDVGFDHDPADIYDPDEYDESLVDEEALEEMLMVQVPPKAEEVPTSDKKAPAGEGPKKKKVPPKKK